MSVGDVFKLAISQTFTGVDDIICTLHYRQELVVIGNEAQDLANQWATDVLPLYRLMLSSRILVRLLEVRPVSPATATYDATINLSGLDSSGDICPLPSAPKVSWRTGIVGRSFKGLIYLPPPAEVNQDAGNLTSGYQTAMSNWAAINMQLLVLGLPQWQQVIYSPTLNVSTPVNAFIVRGNMGSQDRRRQGVGS